MSGEDAYEGMMVLPAIGVATQVGQFLTPDGVSYGMLLEFTIETPDGGKGDILLAVATNGVPMVKNAIAEYEKNLRGVLAGDVEPVVVQAEAL